ncbi:DNA mismatch repair endonuclease MutL [Gracilibacillus caseinilyticus]|uniref:DNA mismatch repair protein MutL n=1 Tax=Gracilibacillus caseinilyticus TaxID=2932256 RepID=A0ABY4ETP8_9BACI|nr:DNA mismatch repair endonuclease MutL [Gracilibacillus caseinilyticus]UOQ47799.1 DNA mismatch repair endonuclease MutL [Gracilibacillus caseinilyticus]
MQINQLPDHLANQIAAGEVVERPASVVKELVENSVDANSSWIKVDIAEAGLQEIKVSDNGSGIPHDQCKKAFLRHATSKIKNETDLFHVHTLGFRGEALASIAAVSRLIIKTSTGEEAGTKMVLEGGHVKEDGRSDARQGTEITVQDIFFNTPARLKYLKTVHTELGHITDIMNRMAFSHPHIRFELTHNGKQIFQTTGKGDIRQIAASVYGMAVAKQMIPVEINTLDYQIKGFIAKPEVNRAGRNYISTIVNGRYIRSIGLAKAITNGFHTFLPIGRQPVVILAITMDPYLIDVNVHPTKLEVRFSKEKELFQAVEQMIKDALHQQRLIPSGQTKTINKEKTEQPQFSFDVQHSVTQQDRLPAHSSSEREQNVQALEEVVRESTPIHDSIGSSPVGEEVESSLLAEEETGVDLQDEIQEEEDQPRVPVMYPIGQHHGTYILAQNENALFIIDQHAAQERIKYEYFRDKIGNVESHVQDLLVPLTFEFTQQEILFIEQYQEELQNVGLFFEPFGQNAYIVRSHPNWFPRDEEESIIRDMVEQLIQDKRVDLHKLREEAAILMSCKRSIKANHYLNLEDMQHLLDQLRTCEEPFTCPHGRPIIIQYTTYEMEKMFKRIM